MNPSASCYARGARAVHRRRHATRIITLLLQAMLPFTRNLAGHYAQALQTEAVTGAPHRASTLVQSAIAHTLFWHSKHFLLQFLLSPDADFSMANTSRRSTNMPARSSRLPRCDWAALPAS